MPLLEHAQLLLPLKKFWRLDRQSRMLLLQACCLLGAMRLFILIRPFKRLVEGLSVHHEAGWQGPLDTESLAVAHRLGWSVRTASRFTPWNSSCLVQVLTAQRMLQQRGIAGVFFLGVETGSDSDQRETFAAHAWLKCGGEFITGEPGHERFRVVSSFSWS